MIAIILIFFLVVRKKASPSTLSLEQGNLSSDHFATYWLLNSWSTVLSAESFRGDSRTLQSHHLDSNVRSRHHFPSTRSIHISTWCHWPLASNALLISLAWHSLQTAKKPKKSAFKNTWGRHDDGRCHPKYHSPWAPGIIINFDLRFDHGGTLRIDTRLIYKAM